MDEGCVFLKANTNPGSFFMTRPISLGCLKREAQRKTLWKDSLWFPLLSVNLRSHKSPKDRVAIFKKKKKKVSLQCLSNILLISDFQPELHSKWIHSADFCLTSGKIPLSVAFPKWQTIQRILIERLVSLSRVELLISRTVKDKFYWNQIHKEESKTN